MNQGKTFHFKGKVIIIIVCYNQIQLLKLIYFLLEYNNFLRKVELLKNKKVGISTFFPNWKKVFTFKFLRI